MEDGKAPTELLDLLNEAIARELQVSTQYMLQHGIGAGRGSVPRGKSLSARQERFVASHSPIWLPGTTLKKVAITEMRHAEAIVERVVVLGGAPTAKPNAIVMGETATEMLANDREQEREAIELYTRIIRVADSQQDDMTGTLFRRILSDEESHHRIFSELLGV